MRTNGGDADAAQERNEEGHTRRGDRPVRSRATCEDGAVPHGDRDRAGAAPEEEVIRGCLVAEPVHPGPANRFACECHGPARARLRQGVRAHEHTPKGLRPAVEGMMRDRFLDGLARLLERRYPGSDGATYEDVVAESVARLLGVGDRRVVDDPRAYITTIAINEMRRVLKRAARDVVLDFGSEDRDDEDEWTPDRDPDERPTNSDAVGRLVFEYVKSLVNSWESRRLQATTLLVLEGAFIGEALSSEEMAERLGDILGEDVLPATARKWRQRGLDRLKAQLTSEGFEHLD